MKSTAEQRYIRVRKVKAFGNRICFYLCRVFPIKRNLISVCTFEGKGGFGCNPKYIVQELHHQDPELEFVWFVNKNVWNDFEFPSYIKKVPNTVLGRAYWLSRSKVWIDNYRKPYGTCKRKGQYYLNTWHGTVGFKCIGLWRGDSFSKMAYLVSKNDSSLIDNVIIDSRWCEEIFPKGLLYDGVFIKTGAPRCDVLYRDRMKSRLIIRRKYGIGDDEKILMYAPTFREKSKDGKRQVSTSDDGIDFARIVERVREKFGGTWSLMTRYHPQVASQINCEETTILQDGNFKIVDVSHEPDMYELLSAVDILITDYSSVAMEAGFMEIPVFIFANDITAYMSERGGTQWMFQEDTEKDVYNNPEMMPNLHLTLPFQVAKSNVELECRIENFDKDIYAKKIEAFKSELELVFDGNASERCAKLIVASMKI